MEIRKAKKSDLSDLFELEKICLKHPYLEKDVLYELEDNPVSNILVASMDNLVIGYIDYWITFDSSTICRICVLPEYRNKGIATKLLSNCENELKNQNVEFLTLEVRASNQSAINFYLKNGFNKVTIKEGYYENGEDAVYMVKSEI